MNNPKIAMNSRVRVEQYENGRIELKTKLIMADKTPCFWSMADNELTLTMSLDHAAQIVSALSKFLNETPKAGTK